MPDSRVYCTLCGLLINKGQQSPDQSRGFRAIYTNDFEFASARVSGPGEHNVSQDLIEPHPSDVYHPPSPSESQKAPLLKISLNPTKFARPSLADLANETPTHWGYAFHLPCWDCFTAASPNPNVQAAFDICRSFPSDEQIQFGHNYGGLLQFQMDADDFCTGEDVIPEIRFPIIHGSLPEYGNPFDIPSLHTIFENTDMDISTTSVLSIPALKGEEAGDAFSHIPPEILLLILVNLPSRSVSALRQASRTFASLALVDEFWKSRFSRRFELGSMWEARQYFSSLSLRHRWKSLYMAVKSTTHGKSQGERTRIWKLCNGLDDLITKREANPLRGIPVDSFFDPQKSPFRYQHMHWVTSSTSLIPPTDSFICGARSLYERVTQLPSDIRVVFVSLANVFGTTYVTGLRFQGGHRGGISTDAELGYIHRASEVPLVVRDYHSPTRICDFYLAQDARGIRGIAISSSERAPSEWAGQFCKLQIRRLPLKGAFSYATLYLKGGFDALKFVSMATSLDDPVIESQSTCIQDSYSWFPDIPKPPLTFLGILEMSQNNKYQLPFTWRVFDKYDQQPQPIVTSITSWIGHGGRFKGLEVGCLGDAEPLKLSVSVILEARKSQFFLDGAGGECITRIETYKIRDGRFLGFEVHTSRGRTGRLPESLLENMRENHTSKETYDMNSGLLVGFYSIMSLKDGLHGLGAITVKRGEKIPVKTTPRELITGEKVLRKASGQMST